MSVNRSAEPCSASDGQHVAEEQIRGAAIANQSRERLERFREFEPRTMEQFNDYVANRTDDDQPKRSRVHDFIAALNNAEEHADADDGSGLPE